MRSALQLLGGVAVAGVVAAGSTAFTAAGLTTSGNAAAAQFIGGTVTQGVTGAALSDIQYQFTDGTKTMISGVTLTFADAAANGKTAVVTPTGGAYAGGADEWYCPTIASASTICRVALASTHVATGYWGAGLTSLSIAVS